MKPGTMTDVSSGSAVKVSIRPNGTGSSESQFIRGTSYRHPAHSNKDIEGAVYAHIQAVRALGQTRVNSVDISHALSLPVGKVEQALQQLKGKGVRIIK